ncbi:MoxR family ATPase [Lentisphaera profundi]|uniref:MoxR family ATPase n=1 Tax=Lentisphaera profundi TaxID=1658616 RepID=A0ABY7VSI2_9BACT|nr:MoxR family ATPase [Lentisphaera profundi]WDE96203.1 MoxR family ATPase [Lentisphaera profundi]
MTQIHEEMKALQKRIEASIIGQETVVKSLIIALLADGNLLLEGLPGLAKTRAVKSLSKNIASSYNRVQFTPDLLPSDITGAEVYLGENSEERFKFEPGPIFANLVLADEINRAPAKVQAALLEAMEEKQITVAGKTHPMPELFMVLATQNPVEQEGTYPLPEAQMDRFLIHILVEYGSDEDELEIMRLVRNEQKQGLSSVQETMSQETLFSAREEVKNIHVAEDLEKYIIRLISSTRKPEQLDPKYASFIAVGASPRGTLALDKCSRSHAWLEGRDHVTPDDVKAVIHNCLRHRLVLSYEASSEGLSVDDFIDIILEKVPVL